MIIYKITNRVNGKVYIGQTTQPLVKRWMVHCCKGSACPYIHRAIQKYGKENFTVEQIDVACDRDELDKKEQYWIDFYDSMNPEKGYNLTSGGDHPKMSEETRKKISEAKKGEKNHIYGKHHSIETRKKMSAAHKGKRKSEEMRKKISGAHHPRARKVLCVETGEVFDCITIASKTKNLNYRNISNVCIGKRNKCGGYSWRYLDE